jgi:hypothetical protein
VNAKSHEQQSAINQEEPDSPTMEARIQNNNFYEIRVNGQLNDRWIDWFDGLNIELLENGEMLLWGRIQDQAALMGVLNKLYRLNLALQSINHKQENKR